MAETYKKLSQGQVAASTAAIHTGISTGTTIIRHIRLVNNHSATVPVELYHDGTGATNKILPALNIAAGGWAESDGVIIMEASDTLQANDGSNGGNKVTYTVYGLELT